jgi:hypothetical protein
MSRKIKTDEVTPAAVPVETATSIKAFDSNFKCRDVQFEVGKTYTATGKIVACRNGFHAVDAENPFHVWDFYPVIGEDGKLTRYAEVTQAGAMDRDTQPSGTKIASASLTVNVELLLPDFIKRAVSALIAKTKGAEGASAASGDSSNLAASGYSSNLAASGDSSNLAASGDYSKLAASGYSSNLAASGDSSKLAASGYSSNLAASGDSSNLAASGDSSKLAASGDSSKLAASGYYSNLAASGDYSKLAASGYSSNLAASGYYSNLAASGDYSNLAASGDSSKLAASGDYSVIAASGPGTRAMGVIGTWMSLAEFDAYGKCVGFANGCIGQDGLEPNVWYIAKGGKLVVES